MSAMTFVEGQSICRVGEQAFRTLPADLGYTADCRPRYAQISAPRHALLILVRPWVVRPPVHLPSGISPLPPVQLSTGEQGSLAWG